MEEEERKTIKEERGLLEASKMVLGQPINTQEIRFQGKQK
jgi:hypothetical protein